MTRMPTCLLLATLGAVATSPAVPGEAPAHGPAGGEPAADEAAEEECALEPDEAAWLQRALDAWSRVTGEILRIPERPLPWIVTFDDECVWHLGAPDGMPEGSRTVKSPLVFTGDPVPVRAQPHDDVISLPNGSVIPARAMAFASVWEPARSGERGTFFVLAMRSVWLRDQPASRGQSLDDFFLGVASHEMVHTRQLVEMARRIEALEERCELPEDVGDTTLEELFSDRPEFAAALRRERDLFYEAAAAADPARRRELAWAALERLRGRRERFFAAEAACYTEVEDLFLLLEGTATWAHYRLARADPGVAFLPEHPELTDRAEILEILRGKNGEWVQEAGFVMFLLLDELAPDWRSAVLGPELASPVELLENALRTP